MISAKAMYALAHPVFDPDAHITAGHTTMVERLVSAGLTVNIGME